jgi:hypothetical protein
VNRNITSAEVMESRRRRRAGHASLRLGNAKGGVIDLVAWTEVLSASKLIEPEDCDDEYKISLATVRAIDTIGKIGKIV